MTVELDGKMIEVDIFLDPEYKALRYELTCEKDQIDPLEAACILTAIAKSICAQFGVTPESLIHDYSIPDPDMDDGTIH